MTSMRESLSDSEAARRRGDFGSQDGRVVVVDDAMAFSTLGDPARLALPAMLPRALVICGGASVTKCLRTAPRASARGWWPRSPVASSPTISPGFTKFNEHYPEGGRVTRGRAPEAPGVLRRTHRYLE